jgi:hypothetical protein
MDGWIMSIRADGFPEQRLIWPGAILGSIAHAIFVCRYPMLSNEQSWDEANYSVQDSAGSRGTIAFAGTKFVGVFFSEESDRNPFHSESHYDLNRFLTGLPRDLQPLAYDEAIQYVMQEFNNAARPVITSAFWGDGIGERIAAAESWAQVFDHGASLIQNQLLNADLALVKWAADYELGTSEVVLAKSLFKQKMASPNKLISPTDSDRLIWDEITQGQEGIEASRVSFAEIGIIMP